MQDAGHVVAEVFGDALAPWRRFLANGPLDGSVSDLHPYETIAIRR